MQTVILCGGKGTRISGGDPSVKKELVEIGGRPILWHIMKIFGSFGYKDFVLPLGYRGDLIRRYFIEYEWMNRDVSFELGRPGDLEFRGENHENDWRLTMIDTGLDTIVGERVRQIARYIDGERFFLTYGDGIGDVDIDDLLRFHLSHGKWVTVTGYQPVYQFGVITATSEGKVTTYRQYPSMDHWINIGFMVIERAALDKLEHGMNLEYPFFGRLVDEGQFMMYRHTGFWRSMDTFKDARELNEMWDNHDAAWKVW
jgi:glucose-1-phosphate cytidylyltransferase